MKKTIRLFTTLMVCMAMALCVSCKKDDDNNNPGGGGGGTQTVATVTTNEVTEITQTTAICGGEVKSENGWAVTERGVCWGTEPNPTPSDNCTVDGEGVGMFTSEITGLEPDTKYYVRAYAKNAAGTGYGKEKSFTTLKIDHEYVDLGLNGLLWATCNVGASKPEDYGNYYAWGETTTKDYYNWNTYKWCNGSETTLTKYNTKSYYGKVDNRTVLEMSDDAAHVNWGGAWRMPTRKEMKDLEDRCTWTWTTQGGNKGYRVTGPNGNSIFLPAAGCYYEGDFYDAFGYYWSSSSLYTYPFLAYSLYFSSYDYVVGDDFRYSVGDDLRYSGRPVRPVCSSQK